MGAYASMLEPAENEPIVAESTTPANFNWSTEHAEATTLSFLEADRLWKRFQQLGASKDGFLEEHVLEQPPIKDNIFMKNQLRALLDESNRVPFQNYCLFAQWLQVADEEDKIRAMFQLFNNGYPLTAELLERVLTHVYPGSTKTDLQVWGRDMVNEIAGEGSESVTEDQFFEYMMRQPQEVREMFDKFRIVPVSIYQEKADMMRKLEVVEPFGSTRANSRRLSQRASRSRAISSQRSQQITDAKLNETAKLLARKDWARVANKLGFLQKDVDQIKRRYKDPNEQIYQVMFHWRQQQGSSATLNDLKKAISSAGFTDIAANI